MVTVTPPTCCTCSPSPPPYRRHRTSTPPTSPLPAPSPTCPAWRPSALRPPGTLTICTPGITRLANFKVKTISNHMLQLFTRGHLHPDCRDCPPEGGAGHPAGSDPAAGEAYIFLFLSKYFLIRFSSQMPSPRTSS